jgi:ABC-type nitrate/sulfonate/bicarbonate transport system permease component
MAGAARQPAPSGAWRPLLLGWAAALATGAVGIAIAVGLWYLAAWGIGRYFPPPPAVLNDAVANLLGSQYLRGLGLPPGGYLPHLLHTTAEVLIGVAIGVGLGVMSGLASARWLMVEQIVDPITAIFGTVPILVAAPFFIIWFGLLSLTQIILVAFYTTMVIHVYALRAVRNVDVKYLEYATTLGADARTTFARVVLPAIVPELFGGIRVAFGASWGLAAIAELLGAEFGVGRVIVSLAAVYDVTGMMAVVLLLGVIALLLDGLIVLLKAGLTRWAATGHPA